MSIGWIWVLFGTLLIAVGGVIATHGWNKKTTDDQRRNVLIGIAREVRLNDRMIKEALERVKTWPHRSPTDTFSYEDYRSAQVAAALTSGLLEPDSRHDEELLKALEEYEAAISQFNGALRIVGRHTPGIFIKTDLIHAEAKDWPADHNDALAPLFKTLISRHEGALAVLESRYPWALQRATIRAAQTRNAEPMNRPIGTTHNQPFERTRRQRGWCAFNVARCVRPLWRAAQRQRSASYRPTLM